MLKLKIIFGIILLFCLCIPTYQSLGQDSISDSEQTSIQIDDSNTDSNTETKTKSKKKDKDVIEINEKFVVNLLIDIATMVLIILLVYYPRHRQLGSIFTFIMFNILIFMLTFVLNKVKISMGAAFGLFAVFSMLRYRTEGISMKDMTYLFIFIATGLISAIRLEYHELAIINGTVILFTFILDGKYILRQECSKEVRYENIELIKPENHKQLMEDLKKRTGLDIHRISIERISFLRDTADIKIFYYDGRYNNHKT